MTDLSVIMSVYNGGTYLDTAIRSILNQTYQNFEFIICNDASTDHTQMILEKFATQDSRIVLIQNHTNMQLAASLNNCIKIAKGKYIARMDDDDISLPDRFMEEINYLKDNPKISLVGTGIALFDSEGAWGKHFCKEKPNLKDVYKGNVFDHPTIMIQKSVLEEVGGYSALSYTSRTEDYDLWCRMYAKGYYGENLQKVLLQYRRSKNDIKKYGYHFRKNYAKNMMICRRDLGLPLWYNIYPMKEFGKSFIPSHMIWIYDHLIRNRG
jgi:glycosyltransferase EpsE